MAIRQKMHVVNSIIRIETVFVRTEAQYCRKYYLAVYNCRLCEIPSEDLPKYKEFIRELREKFYRDNRHIITKKK